MSKYVVTLDLHGDTEDGPELEAVSAAHAAFLAGVRTAVQALLGGNPLADMLIGDLADSLLEIVVDPTIEITVTEVV